MLMLCQCYVDTLTVCFAHAQHQGHGMMMSDRLHEGQQKHGLYCVTQSWFIRLE